ncbi:uncharacterized protein isoform X3 [Macaca fascicularis]|uniref:uncharacterized protein isoform X3 n=1 Tax=Macaca fascicularis TaxID=9541 RepID=UPI003D15E40E
MAAALGSLRAPARGLFPKAEFRLSRPCPAPMGKDQWPLSGRGGCWTAWANPGRRGPIRWRSGACAGAERAGRGSVPEDRREGAAPLSRGGRRGGGAAAAGAAPVRGLSCRALFPDLWGAPTRKSRPARVRPERGGVAEQQDGWMSVSCAPGYPLLAQWTVSGGIMQKEHRVPGQHHYPGTSGMLHVPTWDHGSHCLRPRKPFYSERGWSPVALSQLTAALTSWAQAIRQPPE